MARPYWDGYIQISLIRVPVNLYAAVGVENRLPLHEIDRKSGQRIHHQDITAEGEPVAREDIIKGFEYKKHEYVLLEPDEINKLKIPSSKTLNITEFVPAQEIDPLYFDKPYYVVPSEKDAQEAFTVIREALKKMNMVGIGQLTFGGKERMCSIKPCDKGLLLETLRYDNEIRHAKQYFEHIPAIKVEAEQLELAKKLIEQKTAQFEPEKFHDHYREALQALIEAKRKHIKPTYIEEEKSTGKVINFMDALKKSLNQNKSNKLQKTTTSKSKTQKKQIQEPKRRKSR